MSVTVSLRIEEEELMEIKETGLSPSEFIRGLLRRELRKKRVKRTLELIREERVETGGADSTEIIRELRDSRWA